MSPGSAFLGDQANAAGPTAVISEVDTTSMVGPPAAALGSLSPTQAALEELGRKNTGLLALVFHLQESLRRSEANRDPAYQALETFLLSLGCHFEFGECSRFRKRTRSPSPSR